MTGELSSTAPSGDRDEIIRVATAREQALQSGDLDALMAWFADDAVLTVPASPTRIEGKNALRAYYANLFEVFTKIRINMQQRSVRVYGTAGVINGEFTMTRTDREGKETTMRGRLSVTHVKFGNRWLVVDQHSSPAPASA